MHPITEPLTDLRRIAAAFSAEASGADYWTLRLTDDAHEGIRVRDDIAEPSSIGQSRGAMITVVAGAGVGYGATSDLSKTGLRTAFERALAFAELHAQLGLFDARLYPRSDLRAEYRSPAAEPWPSHCTPRSFPVVHDPDGGTGGPVAVVDIDRNDAGGAGAEGGMQGQLPVGDRKSVV